MLFISSRLHGIFDYTLALFLVLSPWLFDLSENLASPFVLIGAGALLLTIALLTDYELGALRSIPLSLHIACDVVIGLFLVTAPWFFGFEDTAHTLHMLCGVALVAVASLTVRLPHTKRPATQYVQWV